MSEDPKKADLSALVSQIKDVDVDAFHDALRDNLQGHYNKVFRTGYGAAKGEFDPKLTEATTKLQDFQKEIEKREARIKELSEKSPDLAKLEAKWEAALQAKAEEIEKIKSDYDKQLQERDSVVLAERREGFNANLVRSFVELGVDKDYAEVLVAKGDTQERIKWGDERNPRIYQEDKTTPFPASNGKPAYRILAEDLVKQVPGKFVQDRKPTDSGFGSLSEKLEGFESLSKDKQDEALRKLWAGRI